MIKGLHGMFYSSEADAMRAFMRDKLKLPFTDIGEGWLIFDLPQADVGVHPTAEYGAAGKHDVSFFCDDIKTTVAELRARGVVFKQDPADHGYGFVTYFTMPGGVEVQLYQAKYTKRAVATAPGARSKKSAAPRRPTTAAARRASKPTKPASKPTGRAAKPTGRAGKPTRRAGKPTAAAARKRR